MNNHSDPSDAALAPLLATADDLRLNRAGEISPRQRAMLEGYAHASQRWGAMSMLAVLALALVGFASSFAAATRAEDRWYIALGLLTTLVIGLIVWVASMRVQRRLPDANLRMTRGPVAKSKGVSEYGEHYTLHVGGVAFYVASAVFDAFSEGSVYRVYYVAHVQFPIILSFEPEGSAALFQRG